MAADQTRSPRSHNSPHASPGSGRDSRSRSGPTYSSPHTDVRLRAVGRIAAEMISPYPPGIPAVLPGEELTELVISYLTTGVRAGMNLPDAANRTLTSNGVVGDR
ncbi:hypothetical protein ACFV99_19775 [Streptomyces sp. NPDC059944]|uniref:Orn/Lys/Arg family decarboxylase n=1 Tax=unclassified Streptomyces TaxID=2593676 RepID=UPI00362B3C23